MTARPLELFQHTSGPTNVKLHAAQAGFTLCGLRVNGHAWARVGELLKPEAITCRTCVKQLAKNFWNLQAG